VVDGEAGGDQLVRGLPEPSAGLVWPWNPTRCWAAFRLPFVHSFVQHQPLLSLYYI
jgi:hypothetical protein